MAEENLRIGEILKKARENQKLTLEEISLATKIREKYLAALEADNWEALPSSVQQKGFLRSYAAFLHLDYAPLITKLREILDEPGEDETPDLPTAQEGAAPSLPRLMGEIGTVLKKQREKLGFTIVNVEDQIFIPSRYLSAIEEGNLEDLPSTVQGKGMVKNYAQFLGLDPEPLLLNYADVLRDRLDESRSETPEKGSRSEIGIWLRRFIANPTLLWGGVVALIVTVSVWAGVLIVGGRATSSEITPTIPAVADILLPTATPTATSPALLTTPGDIVVAISPTLGDEILNGGSLETTPTPALTGNEKIQLQLIILQRTWVRVTVDNILVFEGRLLPGSVKLFGGEIYIEVLTGNAGGVEVIYNQRGLGVMGLYGEVISQVYTAQGIATPTPTITLTPTPSDTPEPSLTPTPGE